MLRTACVLRALIARGTLAAPVLRTAAVARFSPSSARRQFSSLAPQEAAAAAAAASAQARTTIYALSTPPGKAGVAVFRISGPGVADVYERMVFPQGSRSSAGQQGPRKMPSPRRMVMRDIRVPVRDKDEVGEVIDEGLVVFFEAGKSFTSEPMLELHLHSTPPITSLLLSSLAQLPNLRPALRGEFTQRAFLSGRLDLTEVEGLRDLLEGETELQRRLARQGMSGVTRARFEGIRERVVSAMAGTDALIDFGEDDAIGDEAFRDAQAEVQRVVADLRMHLDDFQRGELLRSGVKVSIFGPPNAGKSSLLNYLSKREAAIVSPQPGTTRDIITVSLDLSGVKAILSDTAGLRATDDAVEQLGIDRAGAHVLAADLRVLVLPLPAFAYPWTDVRQLLGDKLLLPLVGERTVVLFNQVDLMPPGAENAEALAGSIVKEWMPDVTRWWVGSVETGEGMDAFLQKGLEEAVKEKALCSDDGSEELPLVASARQKYHLEQALAHLLAFSQRPPAEVILAAESLRLAAVEIGHVSGRVISGEDVLDKLFGSFCIGK